MIIIFLKFFKAQLAGKKGLIIAYSCESMQQAFAHIIIDLSFHSVYLDDSSCEGSCKLYSFADAPFSEKL